MLVVAHRLSAIKQANHVYVFEAGTIGEQGSHRELLSQDGLYSKLYGVRQSHTWNSYMKSILLFLTILTSVCACQSQNKELVTINGLTMGTTYSIKIVAADIALDDKKIHTDIESILTEINQSMSTYIADSELSLFNQSRIAYHVYLFHTALRYVLII